MYDQVGAKGAGLWSLPGEEALKLELKWARAQAQARPRPTAGLAEHYKKYQELLRLSISQKARAFCKFGQGWNLKIKIVYFSSKLANLDNGLAWDQRLYQASLRI